MTKEFNSIVEELSNLTVVEAAQLVKILEEKWGISAAPVALPQAPQVGGGNGAPAAQQKTAFNVVLKGITEDSKKLGVIKALREVVGPSLGLSDAKAAVENSAATPYTVVSEQPADKVDEVIKKLKEAGAVVEKQ